jgi:pilus assembly protein Flp/PilA
MKSIRYLKQAWLRFSKCDRGSTALEYGLIMALVFLVILAAVTQFSNVATSKMDIANEAITNAGS